MKRKFLSGILILTLIMTYTGTASASPSEDEAASSTSSTSIKEVIIQCLDYIDGQIESALLDSNSDDGDEDADENQSAQSAQADTSKSQSSNLSSSGNNQSSSSSGLIKVPGVQVQAEVQLLSPNRLRSTNLLLIPVPPECWLLSISSAQRPV